MVMRGGSKARTPKSGTEVELRRGTWSLDEDNLLVQYIACNGEGRWNTLAKSAGLMRSGKSCRLRWLNYLKPDIKRGNLSHEEQLMILELHSKWGNRWSKIAQHLPGRTDNEIKNYWRTRVQKQARQLKIDSNSTQFLEAIRMYWMPRLIEKMEQDSSYTASQISSISNFETHNQNVCMTGNNTEMDSISTYAPKNPGFITAPEDDSYHVGLPGYDMKDINHSGCHVPEIEWPGEEDLGSSFWDDDESW